MYVGLPAEVYDTIEKLAAEQGRSTASLGAFALEYFVAFVAPKIYPMGQVAKRYDLNEDDE
jgi:hypothetical protein